MTTTTKNTTIWRLTAMALVYLSLFMMGAGLLKETVGIFDDLWIAVGVSTLAASFASAPDLYKALCSRRPSKDGEQG